MVNSDFRGIILWAVLFVLTYLIYLPFLKCMKNRNWRSEQEVKYFKKRGENG